jgi:putative oxidoreductase
VLRRIQPESDLVERSGPGIRAKPALLPRLQAAEAHCIRNLRRCSLALLRLAIGTVFVWFGALKVANVTPVSDFVANTLPWFDRQWLVPALGLAEIALGVALIAGRLLTLVCAALIAHLAGTFLSLIMQPEVTFQGGNPLMLTAEGEFVIKNLVFIAAALVIAARFQYQEQVEAAQAQEAESKA